MKHVTTSWRSTLINGDRGIWTGRRIIVIVVIGGIRRAETGIVVRELLFPRRIGRRDAVEHGHDRRNRGRVIGSHRRREHQDQAAAHDERHCEMGHYEAGE